MDVIKNFFTSRLTQAPTPAPTAAPNAAASAPAPAPASNDNAFMQALNAFGRLGGAPASARAVPSRRIQAVPGPKLGVKDRMTAALSKASHISGSLLQPIVSMSPTRKGQTRIHFGDRKFYSGTVAINVNGETKRIQVVAEPGFGVGDGKTPNRAFYPLDRNLQPDTSTELYRRTNGEWGVAKQQGTGDPSGKWLPADAFDKIAKDGFKTGYHRVGDREFCVASTMQNARFYNQSKPVMFEYVRGATPAEDRYHAVSADLTRGDAVKLPADMASADPFIGQISSHIGTTWATGEAPEDSGTRPARTAAISAFRAGASVDDAIRLGLDLTYGAKTRLGDATDMSYTAAGACAGILLRRGSAPDVAGQAAQSVVRMAEAIHSAGAYSAATDLTTLPAAGPERQYRILMHSYLNAASGFGNMKDQLVRMDRSDHGADLTALTTAARQLFVEKGYKKEELAGIATQAAKGTPLSKAAVRAEEAFRGAEQALASAADTVGLLEGKQKTAAPRGNRATASPLPPGRGGAQTGRLNTQPGIGKTLPDALAALDAAQMRYAAASSTLMAARKDLNDQNDRIAMAVGVLVDAHAAAPDHQNIALVAARAASETLRGCGDERRAKLAATTAHLALLGGASESDAMTAAHLFARRLEAPDIDLDKADDLRAMQVAYAQVACSAGVAPADHAQVRSSALAAAAAVATLGHEIASHDKVAELMSYIPKAVPETTANDPTPAPVFQFAEPTQNAPKPPNLSAIPAHYEPVTTEHDWTKAPLVPEWGHAKIRQVQNLGFDKAGPSTTTYLVEMKGPQGMTWSEFAWSSNSNQLYGEIPVKPLNAKDGDAASHGKVLVAYNGATARWESFEERTRDLQATVLETMKEIEQLVQSRDDRLSFTRLPYRGKESGFMQNVIARFETQMQEDIRLFVQGRTPQPAFKKQMAALFIDLAKQLEGDRSRKKAIIRHQIDSTLRVFTAAAGASLGGARVAAAFG